MKGLKSRGRGAIAFAALAATLAPVAWSATTIVSSPTGAPAATADASSSPSDISADGRYVVFSSPASNLVAGDGNGVDDIFVRDTIANTTERISVTPAGGDANAESFYATISADGRFVAFTSRASNLVAGEDPATVDLFIRDRLAGTTQFVAPVRDVVDPSGFASFANAFDMSGDGRYVAFHTKLHDLDPLHPGGNLFRFDRQTGLFAAVDLSTAGVPADRFFTPRAPSISADGRYIAFQSADPDLAPGDANEGFDPVDAFLRDMIAGTTERVSPGAGLNNDSPSVSDDGRYVAFLFGTRMFPSSPPLQLRIRDRVAQTTEFPNTFPLASENVRELSISSDGRFVGFGAGTSPPAGQLDVYVYDRTLQKVLRISESPSGGNANHNSAFPLLSADGLCIAFGSSASNLVPGDSNGAFDAFIAPVSFPTTWRSQDAILSSGAPQASVLADDGATSAAIEFYESTNDFGVAGDLPFGSYDSVHPQNWFNKMQAYWSNDGEYPYASKSAIGRGSDTGEIRSFGPSGAMDMQLHPPANNHLTVAAFIVPRAGRYAVSNLAVRRIDANGQTARLYVFNSQGQQISSITAINDRGWVRAFQAYNLGDLNAGDRIYFAVGADGGYEYDATEIAWHVDAKLATTPPATEMVWNSYDNDLPVEYFQTASLSGGNPTPSVLFNQSSGAHPESFNHVSSFIAPAGQLYPYAGRSSVARGSDTGESNAAAPLGVFDMQAHPPEGNTGRTIIAFNVTQPGEYTLSDLAVRRVDDRGNFSGLCVYVNGHDAGGCLHGLRDRAWVRDSQSRSLGTLQAGDKIYFAVSAPDGDYAFDATEIAWKIRANFAP